MKLLPKPGIIDIKKGFLTLKKFRVKNLCADIRIEKALLWVDIDTNGVDLIVQCGCSNSEGYILDISESAVTITGDSAAGAFYGIQTLKQLMNMECVPCLHIADKPDMQYRGVYHDVTRGKVPAVETLKKFIDKLAYYKINSLQIYVEHTFPFKELGNRVEKTGYLSPGEIKELDDYCYDNFIEFIPSIPTFGHLYELLEINEYKKLQAINPDYEKRIFWWMRMRHHTIDPTNDESFEVIKSLIDQYISLFRTDKFNICCDETFDLEEGKHKGRDTAGLYVGFVKKIIAYLKSKGKKVMMWGDILLQYPECINELPEDTEFLNWCYSANPEEESFKTFAKVGGTQIVCPGTGSWSRLVESAESADSNISKMLDYGYRYNAIGMLNTNWGDWGNPCSIELAMHGIVLGAAKSWNISTMPGDEFNNCINALEYKNDNASRYLYMLDCAHKNLRWNMLASCYSNLIYKDKFEITYPEENDIKEAVQICCTILGELTEQKWQKEEYRIEMMSAAEGIMVIAELFAKLAGYKINRVSDTRHWLGGYRNNWIKANKESELSEIEKMFLTLEDI